MKSAPIRKDIAGAAQRITFIKEETMSAEFQYFRPMNWNGLVHEYDLDGSRLLPWDGYAMPFAGAWCVVRPHTKTEAHTQIDQEIFIGIKGNAKLVIGDETYPFTMGDIAAIPKHTNHYVLNDTDEDFHFYVVWWDEHTAGKFMRENSEQKEAA